MKSKLPTNTNTQLCSLLFIKVGLNFASSVTTEKISIKSIHIINL